MRQANEFRSVGLVVMQKQCISYGLLVWVRSGAPLRVGEYSPERQARTWARCVEMQYKEVERKGCPSAARSLLPPHYCYLIGGDGGEFVGAASLPFSLQLNLLLRNFPHDGRPVFD